MKNIILTKEKSEKRFKSFDSEIDYKLYINLKKGKNFSGFCLYTFNLKSTENVFLNFSGEKIETLEINSSEINSKIENLLKEGDLELPEEYLKKGQNSVKIKFSNIYSTDGNGLYTITDTDNKQYVYIQSEPYFNNRVFPLFDQPDLRGRITYFFTGPKDWKIIANTDYENKTDFKDFLSKKEKSNFENLLTENITFKNMEETDYYIFEKTPLLPSYLFCFVAGPYSEIKYTNFDGNFLKMSIFCRESLLNFAKAQQTQIFLFTKRSITQYEKIFQTPNPFKKYDLVFCPEYTIGAMEYPGIITFNDNKYIFKTLNPSPMQESSRGHVITHEIAHMWFGNLVTMKWWNDLWLKESFADFVCYLNMDFINGKLGFEVCDAWTDMLIRKDWGYSEDQLDTTHPIACEVCDTSVAESIFDGITYSKGAAVMKQLYFLIGEKNFSDNIRNYFERFKWGSATLKDFLGEISNSEVKSSHRAYDMEFFNQEWIEKAGLNQIETRWKPDVGGVQKILFLQSAALDKFPTLRYHKLKFAVLDENCEIVLIKDFILENQKETEIEIVNKNYKAIIPNYEDWGYIKVILDQHSINFLKKNLSKIKDSLTIVIIIKSFYDMVKDGLYKGTEFIDLILNSKLLCNLIKKKQILESVLNYMGDALNLIPFTFRDEYNNKMFKKVEKLLINNNSNSGVLFNYLIKTGKSLQNIKILKSILEKTHPYIKKNLDSDKEWQIVYKINESSQFSENQKKIFTNYLQKKDSSDTGKKWLLAINSLSKEEKILENLWENYIDKNKRYMTYVEMAYSLKGFNSEKRNNFLRHKYFLKFFEILPSFLENESKQFGKQFFYYGMKNWGDTGFVIRKLKEVLEKGNFSNFFKIMIRKEISCLEKFKKCCELYEI